MNFNFARYLADMASLTDFDKNSQQLAERELEAIVNLIDDMHNLATRLAGTRAGEIYEEGEEVRL